MTRLRSELQDHPLLGPLVAEYVAGLGEMRLELIAARQDEDWATLEGLAHRLAGSGGSHGFPTISTAARLLEGLASDGRTPETSSACAALDALLAQAQIAAPQPAALPTSTSETEGQLVLVIDDDPAIHKLLALHLRPEEVRLVHALDPEEGYRLARSERPDLILLDVRMPGSDGFGVCHKLKADPDTADSAVIFLSAAEDTDTKVRGFDLGAVDYVVKPFEAPELRARVRAALRTQRYLGLLAREARLDGLTGLGNRRYLQDALDKAVASARRRGRSFCLVMVDVDHFKRLNDTFGHPFGDLVLQHLAAALQGALREEDVACRYGGEEFALLLLDADVQQATVVCDRVHAGLAAMGMSFEAQPVPVTASLGLASCVGRLHGPSPAAEIVEAADKALYAAKQSGRNRTCHL